MLLLGVLASWIAAAPDFDRMAELVAQRWGGGGVQRYQNWRNFLPSAGGGTELDRLKRANEFFNRQIVFTDDPTAWGQPDYWATLLETLGNGRGDCEDFVIAKYFTLKLLGVAPDRLRLVYVRVRTGSTDAVPSIAHMVLAYYAQPDADPLVLDNLITDIRPASRRPDLVPVFSFNSDGIFSGAAGKSEEKIGGIGRLSRWEDLLKRARAEGFE
ncbi:MAG: transglutaminase-like cysteine peptidase [Burkholderiales bacterium]|nr:transglutaminase-like cysteine peptidase [Burkholderiales bacterium]